MRYLSKEIEKLLKQKQVESLIRKQYSCGIFQEYDQDYPSADRSNAADDIAEC